MHSSQLQRPVLMENFLCCRSGVRHYLIEYSIEFSVWSLYQPSFRNGSESVGDSLKDAQLRKDTTGFNSTLPVSSMSLAPLAFLMGEDEGRKT